MSLKGTREGSFIKFLLGFLFWFFCLVTVGSILWYALVPTPAEWIGKFPYNIDPEWWKSVVRHLLLFPEHINAPRLLDFINLAFLTIFVNKIRMDITKAIDEDDKLTTSKYAEWATGSLISGIIFLSSRVTAVDIGEVRVVIYVVAIIVFSSISYFILQRFSNQDKSKDSEKSSKE